MTDRRAALLALAQAAQAAGADHVTVPTPALLEALAAPAPVVAPPTDLLTVEQAAARMRVSPGYLYRRAKSLPFARKVSHRVLRFDAAGLDEWLAAKRRKAA